MTAVAPLGTGRMGSALARAIARSGHELVLWNRTPERARELAGELGGRTAATPAEAAASVEIALTMLADDAAVQSVFAGSDGLIAGAREGTVLVDMSTIRPDTIRGLEVDVRRAGAGVLDAPVSGSVTTAESGQLTVMVGGEPADLDRARPVLESVGKTIFHLGPVGTGAAMKLSVNTLVFALNVAVSEALVLAERAGIGRAAAYEVFQASVVGCAWLGYKRAAFLDPEGTPAAFGLDLAMKDLRLITAVAEALGVPVEQARTNLEAIGAAARDGQAQRDFSWVAEHLRSTVAIGTSR